MKKYSSRNQPLYINKEEKKIKIIVSKEWCEREGGDGNWRRGRGRGRRRRGRRRTKR